MDAQDYQKLAERTECDQYHAKIRMMNCLVSDYHIVAPIEGNRSHELVNIRLNHAILGMCGEVGELAQAFTRYIYYGKGYPVERLGSDQAITEKLKEAIKEETGDLFWYLAEAHNAAGLDFIDTMEANIRKLKARYPEKYEDKKAWDENRDLGREREALVAPGVEVKDPNIHCSHCQDKQEVDCDWSTDTTPCPSCNPEAIN